jgi:hypothetical protein
VCLPSLSLATCFCLQVISLSPASLNITERHQELHASCPLVADMPRLRNRRAHRLLPNTITVEVTVEIHQEDTLSNLYHTNRPGTPPFPVLASPQSSANRHRPQLHGLAQSFSMQEPSRRQFAEAALHSVAQIELRGFRHIFALPASIPGHTVLSIDDVARVVWADISNLLELGLQLTAMKTQSGQMQEAAVDRAQYRIPVHEWLESFEPLVCVDKPLYHMVRDALHAHTPEFIFLRWDALRVRLGATGNTFAALVRQAEETSRHRWSSIVLDLYFLLIEYAPSVSRTCRPLAPESWLMSYSHNEALAVYVTMASVEGISLECHLSAYCTALRLRFYLWRLTKLNPTCRLRTYRRDNEAECFDRYCDRITYLVTQEFARLQNPSPELFQDVKRELVSEPVNIESIARALTSTATEFCTICQHDHIGMECVTPLSCTCVFGRDCLQPLLNRDTPSSYTCPNCRARLHEPLKWKPIESSCVCDTSVGLLWALQSNLASLEREINGDPEPFTLHQRLAGLLERFLR